MNTVFHLYRIIDFNYLLILVYSKSSITLTQRKWSCKPSLGLQCDYGPANNFEWERNINVLLVLYYLMRLGNRAMVYLIYSILWLNERYVNDLSLITYYI